MITNHGYLTPPEQQQWQQVLQDKQPGLILVGLGVPRQELMDSPKPFPLSRVTLDWGWREF